MRRANNERRISLMLCAVVMCGVPGRAVALNNGLAQKPPLAYSNWNIVGPVGEI